MLVIPAPILHSRCCGFEIYRWRAAFGHVSHALKRLNPAGIHSGKNSGEGAGRTLRPASAWGGGGRGHFY